MLDEPQEPAKAREIAFKAAAVVLAVVFFVGVASMFRPSRSGANQAASIEPVAVDVEPDRLVGEFVGRNYILRVYAGAEGPLYTVCDLRGKVLKDRLAADDVYRAFPDLDVRSLHAADGTSMGVVEDAR